MIHGIKVLKHHKGSDTTQALCHCGRFEVTIAGQHLTEAAEHLAFHLRKHGADQ